jgi:hypothetical protein
MSKQGLEEMNVRLGSGDDVNARAEALERLSVFLPASVVRELRNSVPAGRRGSFIARALREALAREKAEDGEA